MGDFSATTSGGMDRLPTDRELNGGIIGYGIGNIISAFSAVLRRQHSVRMSAL